MVHTVLLNWTPLHGRTERLKAATSMYVLQNVAICLSAVASLLALRVTAAWPVPFWFFTSMAIIAGSLSTVGCIGSAVSVEREWTKTLSEGDSDALAHLNSGTAFLCSSSHAGITRSCLPATFTCATYHCFPIAGHVLWLHAHFDIIPSA